MTVNNIRLTDSIYNLSQQIQSIENKLYPNADLSGYLGIKANLISKMNKIALIPDLQKMIVQTERLSLKTQYAMEKSDPQSIKDLQSNLPILKKTKITCEKVYHTCMTAKLSVLTQMCRDTQLDFNADKDLGPKTREKQYAMLIAIKNELILLSHNPYLNNQEKRIAKTLLDNVEELHPLLGKDSSMDLEKIHEFSDANKGQFNPCSEEILIHLLSFLSPKDIVRLTGCSTFFKRICEEESIWKNIIKKEFPLLAISENESAKEICISHIALIEPLRNRFYTSSILAENEQPILCFEKDGNLLFVGRFDSCIEVWDLTTQQQLCVLRGDTLYNDDVACLKKVGNLLFGGDYNNGIKIWDLTDLNNVHCIANVQGHQASVYCFLVVGNRLFSGSDDGTIKIWDLSDLNNIRCIRTLNHGNRVRHLQMDCEVLISGSEDNIIKVWDFKTDQCTIFSKAGTNSKGYFLVKGPLFFSQSSNYCIKVVDLKMHTFSILKGHLNTVTCLETKGNLLFSGSKDNKIKVWDLTNRQCIATLVGHKNEIVSLKIEGDQLFSASQDGSLRVWDLNVSLEDVLFKFADMIKNRAEKDSSFAILSDRIQNLPSFILNEIQTFDNLNSTKDAFSKIVGFETSNEKKIEAIHRYLLKRVIQLFKKDRSQKAVDLFNKLPEEIKIAVSDHFSGNNGFIDNNIYIEAIEQFLDKTSIRK